MATFRCFRPETIDVNRIFYPLALLALVAMSGVDGAQACTCTRKTSAIRPTTAMFGASRNGTSPLRYRGRRLRALGQQRRHYVLCRYESVKEVSETYRLPNDFITHSNRLKRRTFPISVASMLIVVGIVTLGGEAESRLQLLA